MGNPTNTLKLRNPNSVDSRLVSMTIEEETAPCFSVDAKLPLVIAPKSEQSLTVRFNPPDTGLYSGTFILVFGSPRRDTLRIPLSVYAKKLPLDTRMPNELHILQNEKVRVPLYAESSLEAIAIKDVDLRFRYDATVIEDIDIELDGTHSASCYYEIEGDAGDRVYHLHSYYGTIAGGKPNDSLPLVYVKFKSRTLDASQIYRADIDAELIIRSANAEDECIRKHYSGGAVIVDSTCTDPHLIRMIGDSNEAYLAAPYPNPSSGTVTVELDIPRSESSAPTRIEVFYALGRMVNVLHDGFLAAGTYKYEMDIALLPAGVYNCSIESSLSPFEPIHHTSLI